MALEIERKFLVAGDSWRGQADGGTRYRQGYLHADAERTVRVRIAGDHGYLTIKGRTEGATRSEFEYEIPLPDARAMLDQLCPRPQIEKTRYRVRHGTRTWELDVFAGENAGLLLAEIELDSVDEEFETPPWAGEEVTADPRYYNAALARRPFSRW